MEISSNLLLKKVVEAITLAECNLPPDVENIIRRAYETETEMGKAQLKAILENVRIAREMRAPICQDTGLFSYYVEIGDDFPIRASKIKKVLIDATVEATRSIPLRPNAIDVLTEKNTGNNVGQGIPDISWDHVDGNTLRIAVLPKGGGSSYVAKLHSIPPAKGLKGVVEAVIRSVFDAGSMPCPPTFVGIGIGGTEDLAMKLAKKALLARMDENSKNEELAKLEREIVDKANSLGIGPMGLGGRWTIFNARIEWASRHPATLLTGVCFSCWALRKAFVEVSGDEIRVYQ
ncbi:MAG: fumarate hydratase [Candidatus Korarchaeota archaeon]|nr:fumarate hydratase [Thermoproteota archaeon]MCR8471255.1 fumarate hydratase [Thermoproteota archaeon]MCR8472052.1 fumarate hydratase [Thermoproteota archaeon]MCR8473247.1 fumarate hydratase [Thermoproteota archaeon]MCR8488657.1 fumarate hydratase [Thermoproteota archaeon]